MVDTTPKEIRIGLPTPFNGTRENLVSFINECALYCDLNAAIYDTDLKKVIFMLFYMKGGTAQAWKESFITAAIEKAPVDYRISLKNYELLSTLLILKERPEQKL